MDKKLQYILTILALLLLTSCQGSNNSPTVVDDALGEPLVDMTGKAIHFAPLRGKWVLVNYWASWCDPCLAELPELNKLYQAKHDKVMVIGVNIESLSKAMLLPVVQQLHITYPVTQHDPSLKLGIEPIDVVPTTVVIDPQGRVLHTLYGEQTQKGLTRLLHLS